MPTLRFGLCKIDHGIEERSIIGVGKHSHYWLSGGRTFGLFIVRKQIWYFISMNWGQI